MSSSRGQTPQRRERDKDDDRDRDRDRHRDKRDKHRSSDDKDKRDKRRDREEERDKDRGDRDRDDDRGKDRDRDERRDKEKRDKHRDREREEDRDKDRHRDKSDKHRTSDEKDRDRDKRRSEDKDRDRDRDRRKDEDRDRRDRDEGRDRGERDDRRDRDREDGGKERDRERDERRDKEKRDKHRDRERDEDRDKDRDRDERRDREKRDKRRDEDRDRDREDKSKRDKKDKSDTSRSHSKTITVRTVESAAAPAGYKLINDNSSPSTPIPQSNTSFQQHQSQSQSQPQSALLGGGLGVQPSGAFGAGNMFMFGSGPLGASNSMGTVNNISVLHSNLNGSTRPTSAVEAIKMIPDDSDSDDGKSRTKRGAEKESKDKDKRSKKDKHRSSKHRSASNSSSSEDGRRKRGANASNVQVMNDSRQQTRASPDDIPTVVASYNPMTRTTSMQSLLPPAVLQLGYIVREKAGLFSSKGDTFNFFIEPSRKFVLAARRRARKKTPNYLISLTADDLSRESTKFHGKVRANFAATEYVFYDNGVSPEDYAKEKAVQQRNGNVSGKALEALLPKVRREIGAAIFEGPGTNAAPTGSVLSNAFKTHVTQPRRIVILLPAFDPANQTPTKDWCAMPDHASPGVVAANIAAFQPPAASTRKSSKKKGDSSSDDSDDERENQRNIQQQSTINNLMDKQLPQYGSNCFSMLIQTYYNHMTDRSTATGKASLPEYPKDVIVMHNRLPQWNENAKAFQLNFKGRVGQSSVKNFQLVQLSDGGMSERFPMGSQASPDLAASKQAAKEEQRKKDKRDTKEKDKKKSNHRAEMTGLTVQNYSDDDVEVIDAKAKSSTTQRRSPSSSSSGSDVDPRTKPTPNGGYQYPLHQHSPTHGIEKFDPDRVVMQFGKRDDKTFSLDFMAPINATQAMCIALTSFDGKVGLE